jgi:hypothetical protein
MLSLDHLLKKPLDAQQLQLRHVQELQAMSPSLEVSARGDCLLKCRCRGESVGIKFTVWSEVGDYLKLVDQIKTGETCMCLSGVGVISLADFLASLVHPVPAEGRVRLTLGYQPQASVYCANLAAMGRLNLEKADLLLHCLSGLIGSYDDIVALARSVETLKQWKQLLTALLWRIPYVSFVELSHILTSQFLMEMTFAQFEKNHFDFMADQYSTSIPISMCSGVCLERLVTAQQRMGTTRLTLLSGVGITYTQLPRPELLPWRVLDTMIPAPEADLDVVSVIEVLPFKKAGKPVSDFVPVICHTFRVTMSNEIFLKTQIQLQGMSDKDSVLFLARMVDSRFPVEVDNTPVTLHDMNQYFESLLTVFSTLATPNPPESKRADVRMWLRKNIPDGTLRHIADKKIASKLDTIYGARGKVPGQPLFENSESPFTLNRSPRLLRPEILRRLNMIKTFCTLIKSFDFVERIQNEGSKKKYSSPKWFEEFLVSMATSMPFHFEDFVAGSFATMCEKAGPSWDAIWEKTKNLHGRDGIELSWLDKSLKDRTLYSQYCVRLEETLQVKTKIPLSDGVAISTPMGAVTNPLGLTFVNAWPCMPNLALGSNMVGEHVIRDVISPLTPAPVVGVGVRTQFLPPTRTLSVPAQTLITRSVPVSLQPSSSEPTLPQWMIPASSTTTTTTTVSGPGREGDAKKFDQIECLRGSPSAIPIDQKISELFIKRMEETFAKIREENMERICESQENGGGNANPEEFRPNSPVSPDPPTDESYESESSMDYEEDKADDGKAKINDA